VTRCCADSSRSHCFADIELFFVYEDTDSKLIREERVFSYELCKESNDTIKIFELLESLMLINGGSASRQARQSTNMDGLNSYRPPVSPALYCSVSQPL
jgi:hypothetical protein